MESNIFFNDLKDNKNTNKPHMGMAFCEVPFA